MRSDVYFRRRISTQIKEAALVAKYYTEVNVVSRSASWRDHRQAKRSTDIVRERSVSGVNKQRASRCTIVN